ncbi:ROK family transcriptional regulator [Dactylosporangium aurantiacum]|uniref:ROK family transcriptional regulator n=1 Tax=Dactylosporangium aurantiacum TaxID=35754 RepID=A0A9Q9IIW2_9ACTN|nr:ROK family transcriptional regulator [Dactylosporangium aurantiacum]MDG6105707.1 ROK family transcriptional regulator [Dactylosporangium aurantiacum]UWZ56969.1 ROK family transcriptional regulator [Dactylosporangium aurantiacum]
MDTPGAHLEHLRDYNESLVVALARTRAEFDRAGVAEATGLTPQAVSKVLGRLTGQGLVEVCGVRRQGVGKPASIYRLVPGSRHAVGIHVARRTLRTVLTDLAGTVLTSTVTPLPPDFTPGQLLDAVRRDARRTGGDPVGVGIGMVGPLDHAAGIVRDAHRLRHWHDVPLRQLAQEALGVPVHLDKDVTAGVTAEAWRRGPTFRDGALIMVESGIGAGLWLGGAAYRGAHTNAGEFGHTVMQLDGPRCVCGRSGCLEILHDTAVAAGRLDTAARVLATGIVNLLRTTDVNHVVLAGADLLRHPEVYEHATRAEIPRSHWQDVSVTLAELGADVIAAGAAMQVLDAAYGIPSKMGVRSLF